MVSVRAISTPVLQLNHSQDVSTRAFAQALVRAVEEDGGYVIVLICTGTTGWGAAHRSGGGAHKGYLGIPVVEPALCALKLCEALVDMGLAHSKRTHPFPRAKLMDGWLRSGVSTADDNGALITAYQGLGMGEFVEKAEKSRLSQTGTHRSQR